MVDDVGWCNPSCYHNGLMSSRTPNIDRIAAQGMRFTDYDAQPSCTAGRSAFLTGQFPLRNRMHTVGLPGDVKRLDDAEPTVAKCFRRWDTRPVNLARTTWVIRMQPYRPVTASMNRWAGFITSMPWSTPPIQTSRPVRRATRFDPETLSTVLSHPLKTNRQR